MESKKYSSYAEIEQDLEILKLEKEIYYQKMLLSIDKTKESILPSKSVSLLGNLYQKVFLRNLRNDFKATYSVCFQLVYKQKKRRLSLFFL